MQLTYLTRTGDAARGGDAMHTNQRGDIQTVTAEWLRPISWQLFATLSFASPHIRYETAVAKFHEMTNTVERAMRTRLGYLYTLERRSRSGAVVPLHFHAAFVSTRPIEYQLVAGAWAGDSLSTHSIQELARLEPYDHDRAGVEYIVKQINDPDCESDFKHLRLFNGSPLSDHMQSREARRWSKERLAGADQSPA
jgi:hypothetical protein